jgi:DNA polymerase III delta subunit
MIRIFLGTDTLSKEQQLKTIASQMKAELRRFNEGDIFPDVSQFSESTLFGPTQVFVFDNSIGKSGLLDNAELLMAAPSEIIILEEAAPKRGNAILALSKNPAVKILNFDPPSLDKIPAWLAERAKHYGASITKDGIQVLLDALIPEPASSWEKPVADLRMLDHELLKLATYADGNPITAETVSALTKKNTSTQVWHVINAIADKNSKTVFSSLEKFMADSDAGTDDKAKLILLNALLADQFRNILLVQDFQNLRVPDQEILTKTGWKSGRLYQLKKLAGRFTMQKLRQILQRLEDLDIELKTTSTPARPIMDLILAQVL